MASLEGRVIWVTGATGGVGESVVATLLEEGACVIASYRHPEGFEHLLKRVGAHERLCSAPCDLLDAEAARQVVVQWASREGAITGLVHLVGGFASGARIAEAGHAAFAAMWENNVATLLNALSAVVPMMEAQQFGRIVAIASAQAFSDNPGVAPYATAKATVIDVMRRLAKEEAGRNISANALVPGTIDTPANHEWIVRNPPHNLVTPQEIARVVRFLLTEEGGILTGGALPVRSPSAA